MQVQSITNPVRGRHWDVIQDLLAPSPVLNSLDLEIAEVWLPSCLFLTCAISDKGLGGFYYEPCWEKYCCQFCFWILTEQKKNNNFSTREIEH